MQDPVYNLKNIINDAIDLYRQIIDEDAPTYAPEEIVKIGKDIKEKVEGLVDMAWYKVDSENWDEKHPGHVGTKLK